MSDKNRYTLIRRISVVFLITMLFSYVSFFVVMRTNGSTTIPPAISMRDSKFDEGWFDGIRNTVDDIQGIKTSLKEGDSLVRPEAWRTLLSDHFDVFTLLILPLGTEAGFQVLKAAMFIRTGLAAAAMALFLERSSRNSRLSVLLLSVIYGLSGLCAVSALDIRIINFMIFLPVTCLFIRELVMKEGKRYVLLAAFSFAVLFSTGITGLVTGLPMALVFALFLAVSLGASAYDSLVAVMKTLLSGILGGLMALLPILCQIGCAGRLTDIKAAFKDTTARGVLFDFLTDLTDGKPFDASSGLSSPAFGCGMIVLLLLVLFFANNKIPFGLRIFTGAVFLVFYLGGAVSSVDKTLSIFENGGSFLLTRHICLLFLFLVVADMSLEKIKKLGKETVIISMSLILGMIIISNSSATDISPAFFSLYYSAAAVIFWCVVILKAREGKGKLPARAIYIGLAGIIFNYLMCLGPASFSGSGITFDGSFVGGEASTFNVVLSEGETFPLFGTSERDLYTFAPGDLSQDLEGKSLPELMNLINENAFYKIPARTVSLDNAEEPVPGLYTTSGDVGDIIIRANGLTSGGRYYISTGFDGRQYLTQSYSESDSVSVVDGPSLVQIVPEEESADLKLSFKQACDGQRDYSLWEAQDGLAYIEKSMHRTENGMIELADNRGDITVITSIPFNRNYRVYMNGGDGYGVKIFDFGGRIAFTTPAEGRIIFEIKDPSLDIIGGLIVSVIFTCSAVFSYVYMYNKKNIFKGRDISA